MLGRKYDVSSTQDMTTGKSAGLILRFSIPLIFGNLFQQLYSIVDAVVVGRFIGVDALASIGCVSWLCWMINALFRDTANAFSIAASVRVGNRDFPWRISASATPSRSGT